MSLLADVSESRDLVVNLTLRELRGKYKRSILGWSWSLLNPLAATVIFSLVFGVLLRFQDQLRPGDPSGLNNFAAFLMCGLLPWNFFSASLNGSMAALLGNAGIIKKVYFPRQILIVATVLALDVSFLIELAVLAGFLLFLGSMVLPWLVPMLGLVVVLTMFCIGSGLVVSVLNVYFRDMQYLVGIVLQMWFYLTPIIYPPSLVEGRGETVEFLYGLNPMTSFVDCFRAVLYDLRWPDLGEFLYATGWSIALLVLGVVVFRRFDGRLAEEL